jgi:hypothetical protein
VPLSLLSPVLVSQVMAEEQRLTAAAGGTAAGAAGAEAQQAEQPEVAASGEAPARSPLRKDALAAVMMGRQVAAVVVNVDRESGRVVLSGGRVVGRPGWGVGPLHCLQQCICELLEC